MAFFPKEPTQAMIDAGADVAQKILTASRNDGKLVAARVWRAMVDVLHAEISASAGEQTKE